MLQRNLHFVPHQSKHDYDHDGGRQYSVDKTCNSDDAVGVNPSRIYPTTAKMPASALVTSVEPLSTG